MQRYWGAVDDRTAAVYIRREMNGTMHACVKCDALALNGDRCHWRALVCTDDDYDDDYR
jgi:hypothetical protein